MLQSCLYWLDGSISGKMMGILGEGCWVLKCHKRGNEGGLKGGLWMRGERTWQGLKWRRRMQKIGPNEDGKSVIGDLDGRGRKKKKNLRKSSVIVLSPNHTSATFLRTRIVFTWNHTCNRCFFLFFFFELFNIWGRDINLLVSKFLCLVLLLSVPLSPLYVTYLSLSLLMTWVYFFFVINVNVQVSTDKYTLQSQFN